MLQTTVTAETLQQANEWGRAIVQAYMGWYVFFVAGNIAMLGWIHTRRAIKATKDVVQAFRNIARILAFLNFGGIVSSGYILSYLLQLFHGTNHPLIVVIFVAGIANTLALVALLAAWIQVLRKRTYVTISIKE